MTDIHIDPSEDTSIDQRELATSDRCISFNEANILYFLSSPDTGETKILLLKNDDDLWDLPGGRLPADSQYKNMTVKETAINALYSRTGITVRSKQLSIPESNKERHVSLEIISRKRILLDASHGIGASERGKFGVGTVHTYSYTVDENPDESHVIDRCLHPWDRVQAIMSPQIALAARRTMAAHYMKLARNNWIPDCRHIEIDLNHQVSFQEKPSTTSVLI